VSGISRVIITFRFFVLRAFLYKSGWDASNSDVDPVAPIAPIAPAVGHFVGVTVGTLVGVLVGTFVGVTVGTLVGVTVGTLVGVLVGTFVGHFVGVTVGVLVGTFVGHFVGVTVGVLVGVIKRMKSQKDESKVLCKSYIDKMIENRDELVANLFKFKNENGVRLPVGFQYIIGNIHGQLNLIV
jgi:hypothetical protein